MLRINLFGYKTPVNRKIVRGKANQFIGISDGIS